MGGLITVKQPAGPFKVVLVSNPQIVVTMSLLHYRYILLLYEYKIIYLWTRKQPIWPDWECLLKRSHQTMLLEVLFESRRADTRWVHRIWYEVSNLQSLFIYNLVSNPARFVKMSLLHSWYIHLLYIYILSIDKYNTKKHPTQLRRFA